MRTAVNIENIGDFSLFGLSHLNVILGKNGCGKSYLLKHFEQHLRSQEGYGKIRYVSPERGGSVKYEPNIDQNIGNNPKWMDSTRRKNQSPDFRQQSAVLFRRLELMVLRENEAGQCKAGYQRTSFEQTIEQLNTLLDRVELSRHDETGFKILDKVTKTEVSSEIISSGESELISLGIEILSFVMESRASSHNIIFIDEPDLHLHPDLQHRLAAFIVAECKGKDVTVVLATHSTALLAGLAADQNCHVAFMKRNDRALSFQIVSEIDKFILPIFGAHPLSNVFNQSPVLLVEGDDDARVWQQAVRTANGKLRLYPCPVDSINQLSLYETEVSKIVLAVYDNPKAYSLRDRDGEPVAIDDVGPVIRMRLNCRAAENLMLSDDVLQSVGTTWDELKVEIGNWNESNKANKYHDGMKAFAAGGFERQMFDLKEIRNILLGLLSNKPWEVLVGQSIAKLVTRPSPATANSLREYLGVKVISTLLGLT